MLFHVHTPPSTRAIKGTAGSDELNALIGHEPGAQGATVRSTPGQHGSSPQPYRTAVISDALNAPRGRAATAAFQSGARSPVVAFLPHGCSYSLLKHLLNRRAESHTPPARKVVTGHHQRHRVDRLVVIIVSSSMVTIVNT